jgi:hypothetical protein
MIMRRLSRAIAQQNWFIVFIEVLVVVIGIFIGLQVDDWNSLRHDWKDEKAFLQQLHSDVLLAEKLSSRVRSRRLNRLKVVNDINEILFRRNDTSNLSDEECLTASTSNYFNIVAPSLPAFDELVATGRLGIIQDTELRRVLIGLEQTREALATMIMVQSGQSSFTYLPARYPELMQLSSYYHAEMGEIRSRASCDLTGMRANQAFLNDWSANADGYDAYIRDGLAPWSAQLDNVHQIVDVAIGVEPGHAGT